MTALSSLAPWLWLAALALGAHALKTLPQGGTLVFALAAGTAPEPAATAELGQIIAGQRPGRRSPDQITIADLTGTGVQDTAIATHALAAFSDEA